MRRPEAEEAEDHRAERLRVRPETREIGLAWCGAGDAIVIAGYVKEERLN